MRCSSNLSVTVPYYPAFAFVYAANSSSNPQRLQRKILSFCKAANDYTSNAKMLKTMSGQAAR
jgi:hypothetical protein